MLSLLHIENIAVIESADIRFGPGFNALTGETGAGKSIVVDAISAIIGERTSRDLIRTGTKAAVVEAVFTGLPALSWFNENGIGPDEDGNLLLRREIQSDGKNICRLAGRFLTVSQLKTLGGQLVNIHGQHDGQQLLDERCHLSYLDRFGGADTLLTDYTAAFDTLSAIQREIASLRIDEAEKARRIDSLNYQIKELERAGLQLEEEEPLLERRDLLRNSGRLIEAVEGARLALSGDDDSEGACAMVAGAEQSVGTAAHMSADLATLRDRLTDLRCAADDIADTLRDLRESFDFEPSELDEIETRLDTLHRLKKKYGASIEEMLAYLDRCKAELNGIEDADDTILKLEKKYASALKSAKGKAEALSKFRHGAAHALQERIQAELAQLDMPKVQFQVDFSAKGGNLGMDSTGMDEVQFLMSANMGEALKPIQKVASGGELARIMLCLKNVLAENDDITTLVFDEVDTGVSGRAAQRVAEKMADVAARKQVLCVTHLPQIAAMADTHFSVEKGESNGRTFTRVEVLDRPRRKEELARLTGGVNLSVAMLAGAGELLDDAAMYKCKK